MVDKSKPRKKFQQQKEFTHETILDAQVFSVLQGVYIKSNLEDVLNMDERLADDLLNNLEYDARIKRIKYTNENPYYTKIKGKVSQKQSKTSEIYVIEDDILEDGSLKTIIQGIFRHYHKPSNKLHSSTMKFLTTMNMDKWGPDFIKRWANFVAKMSAEQKKFFEKNNDSTDNTYVVQIRELFNEAKNSV